MMVLGALIREFNGHVAFRERRPGVLQVLAPLFHEDGDMGCGRSRTTASFSKNGGRCSQPRPIDA